jgi:hypothetical protein
VKSSQQTCSKSEFVAMYGIAERSVERYIQTGMPHVTPKAGETRLLIPQSYRWWQRRDLARSIQGPDGQLTERYMTLAHAIMLEVSGCYDDGREIETDSQPRARRNPERRVNP